MSSDVVWHCWWLTSTEHLLQGKQSGIGIGIGNGRKVGRIQVKFDSVPLDNAVNKFEGGIGRAGGSGGGGGGRERGGRNGYEKGDDQGMVDGRRSDGCQVRLRGRLGGVNDVWSTRRIFPFESDGDEDRWRFDDDDEGETVRGISFVFALVFDGVGWRCGTKIFRRLDSINCCSRFFFSNFFIVDTFCSTSTSDP